MRGPCLKYILMKRYLPGTSVFVCIRIGYKIVLYLKIIKDNLCNGLITFDAEYMYVFKFR